MINQPDYKKVIATLRDAWVKVAPQIKVTKEGGIRIMEWTTPHEFTDSLLIFKINCDHGFTPVQFTSDSVFKSNSKFPGKVESDTAVTAKWEKVDDVWVPVHHRLTGGRLGLGTEVNDLQGVGVHRLLHSFPRPPRP